MNAPLSHTAVFNLWNVEADREQRTEVRTFWFDMECDARAFMAGLDGDVRFFRQPRSALGPFRVVSYRPASVTP
jgi:hypothetical protein